MTTFVDYPVGICDDSGCHYDEPHRHGFDCDEACACAGIGAETRPIEPDDLATCDWGYCNRPSVALRREPQTAPEYAEEWLAVCRWHAGWLDTEPTQRESS